MCVGVWLKLFEISTINLYNNLKIIFYCNRQNEEKNLQQKK